jgi:hypothetical protein
MKKMSLAKTSLKKMEKMPDTLSKFALVTPMNCHIFRYFWLN